MLQMSKHKLNQAQHLYNAIDRIDGMLEFYRNSKGPAYLVCEYVKGATTNIQLNPDIMIIALQEQRSRYIVALNEMGIDYVVEQPQ